MAINIFPETGDTLDGALWQKLNKALGLGYQIAEGLTLDDGADADSVYVQPGKALINGKLVEITSETALDLAAGAADHYHIFLKDDGTLTSTVGTSQPTGEWICLGNIYWTGSDLTVATNHTRDVADDTSIRGMASREGRFVYRHRNWGGTVPGTKTEAASFTFDVKEGEMWYVHLSLTCDSTTASEEMLIEPECTGTGSDVYWGYIGSSYQGGGAGYGPKSTTSRVISVNQNNTTSLQIFALVVGGSDDGVMKWSIYGRYSSTTTQIYAGSFLTARRLYG